MGQPLPARRRRPALGVARPDRPRAGGTGVLRDLTIGVNWYLNPNFKLQWNYVRAWRDSDTPDRDGHVDMFGMRVAFDF